MMVYETVMSLNLPDLVLVSQTSDVCAECERSSLSVRGRCVYSPHYCV